LFTCVVLLLSFHPPRQPEGTCNCSSGSEGILDPDKCNQSTGQCSCLMGYTGLQCEECEEEYFTNGTSGCLPCSCDSFGALNLDCDRRLLSIPEPPCVMFGVCKHRVQHTH
ncbi:hypothetical protein ILYODFUR_033618, partial [Ilyodon furcidens]